MEIVIEGADAREALCRLQADHFVGLPAHRGQGLARGDGDGQHDLGRAAAAQRVDRRFGGGACRQAVVDDDNRTALGVQERAALQIERPAALDLGQLPATRLLEVGLVGARQAPHVFVDHGLGPGPVDDSGERKLRRAGRPDLAHQQQIQRRVQRPGDLGRHWGAPAG
jgi:hypothetical protein